MNTKFHYLLISFLLWTSDSFAQVIESGKIVNGFLECVIIDSTDQVLMEAESMKMFFEMMPKETIYFNEAYIIKVINEDSIHSLLEYEDRKTNLIYHVYTDTKQKVYAIDSNVLWFMEDLEMMALLDSVKVKSEKSNLHSKTVEMGGFKCFPIMTSDKNRNEDGYQKLYVTKDLGLRFGGDSPARKMDGYPVRIEVAVENGLEMAMGILEWEKLPPDHPIFRLDLDKYKMVTMDELAEIKNSSGY
jgi:hypothetical protein